VKKPGEFIREEVRNTPPSGIRKYFDMLSGLSDVISLGVGSRTLSRRGRSENPPYIHWKRAELITHPIRGY